jgi:hypothetical protein
MSIYRAYVYSIFAIFVISAASVARGGTITAYFNDPQGIDFVNFNSTFPTGQSGGASAAIVDATRTDTPGPGVDSIIPTNFRVFCVEVGQDIYVPQTSTFANVELLSPTNTITTNPGADTGPVVFDATRTVNIEKLFGAFYPSSDTDTAANDAFQLALWKLAFDSDFSLTLDPGNPNQRMWIDPSNEPSPSIVNTAQGYLTAIQNDVTNQLPEAQLALLTDPTIQDQLALIPTNVSNLPEPVSLSLVAPAALLLLRRRRA